MNHPEKPALLIVDDEQNFTESLQLAIEDEYTVLVAGSLAGARQMLGSHLPDAILLDLMLPDGDGLELFHDIKKLAKPPIVIIMTAYASLDSYVKAVGKGSVKYFTKPLNIAKLKQELHKHIENRNGGGMSPGSSKGTER